MRYESSRPSTRPACRSSTPCRCREKPSILLSLNSIASMVSPTWPNCTQRHGMRACTTEDAEHRRINPGGFNTVAGVQADTGDVRIDAREESACTALTARPPRYLPLLRLATERTSIRPRVERLAAVPAEPGRWREASLEPALDVVGLVEGRVAPRVLARGTSWRRRRHRSPRGEHIVQQFAGALIARMDLGGHGLENDVVDGLRQFRVPEPRRRQQVAARQPTNICR